VRYDVKAWSKHVAKVACDTTADSKGSTGLRLVQVDEYQTKITPLNETCSLKAVKELTRTKPNAPKLESDDFKEGLGPILPELDIFPSEIPALVDDSGTIISVVPLADGRKIQDESDLQTIYNEVAGMSDNWYWRDKPLSKNSIKPG